MGSLKRDNLRILLLALDKYPPFRVDLTVLFGKELLRRGHTIDWLLQSDADAKAAYETRWSECRVWVGPTDNGTSRWQRARKNLLDIAHDLRMFPLLRKHRYDFIVVRDKFLAAMLALIAARLHGTRCVFWLSYPFPENYIFQVKEGSARYPLIYWLRGNFLKFLCYRVVMPFVAHSFVQTERMLHNIEKHGIPADRMTPVPMAVAVDEVPFFGHGLVQKTGREKKISYLGTLVRTRHLDFLVRVLARVLEGEPDAVLYLVGGGEDAKDEEILRAEASRLGIADRVIITGFLPQKGAWQHIRDAHVCVSPIYPTPTLECGSPTKLLEYMAMGKAVVANDHPEQQSVLADSGGGICVPYNEEAFAQAILRIFNRPSEASEMGRKGREYVEKKRNYRQAADLVEKKLHDLLEEVARKDRH
ncbi:MAG: glycosyltransferase family 4 protein [Deltaproteobacteria bacterium]|nr:glycosyltransferase family 4 protein [Deltaproteobacteria bacterium]